VPDEPETIEHEFTNPLHVISAVGIGAGVGVRVGIGVGIGVGVGTGVGTGVGVGVGGGKFTVTAVEQVAGTPALLTAVKVQF